MGRQARLRLDRPGVEMVDARAAEVLRSLVSFTMGYGLQEIGLWPASAERGVPAGEREFLVSLGQALPAGAPTYLIDTAIALCADCDPDACFEFGLELIVQSVRQLASQAARRGPRARR